VSFVGNESAAKEGEKGGEIPNKEENKEGEEKNKVEDSSLQNNNKSQEPPPEIPTPKFFTPKIPEKKPLPTLHKGKTSAMLTKADAPSDHNKSQLKRNTLNRSRSVRLISSWIN
jgi:hypothetical protein